MKCQAHVIDNATYFVNELQIKEAGSVKGAAEKMHAERMEKLKPKKAKVKPDKKSESTLK